MSEEKIAGAPVATEKAPEPAPEPPPAARPVPAMVAAAPPTPPPPVAQPTLTQAANETPKQSKAAAEAAELAAALRKELEAAQAARQALDQREAQASSAERVAFLRKAGAMQSLSDEHLLALSPQVDIRTQAGREKLTEWTEQNAGLFQIRETNTVEVQQAFMDQLKTSHHGVFGKELHQKLMKTIGRGQK